MKKDNFKISAPLQLVMDDVGWMEGRTPYWWGWQPSRTGIPRRHVLEDYIMVNEVGRSANMKINVMFVIGEWDRHNILRRVPYSNRDGDKWDCTQYLDIEEAEKMRDFLNSCEYIEMGIHGLLHECWDVNGEYLGAEFVTPEDFKLGAKKAPAPEWYLRSHLDAFMEIYNDWGFTQKLRSFSCPGHCDDAWKRGIFARVLKDYGVKFWHQLCIEKSYVDQDIIMTHKDMILAPWEAYDINPAKLPTYEADKVGILSSHWPNVLRYDPDKNQESLGEWKEFFKRQSEVFGIILSRDIAFAHHQLLYKNCGVVEEVDGKIRIDLTKADAMAPSGPRQPLYVSIRNTAEPIVCEGGIISEYEAHKDFKNYKIERTEASVIYLK